MALGEGMLVEEETDRESDDNLDDGEHCSEKCDRCRETGINATTPEGSVAMLEARGVAVVAEAAEEEEEVVVEEGVADFAPSTGGVVDRGVCDCDGERSEPVKVYSRK